MVLCIFGIIAGCIRCPGLFAPRNEVSTSQRAQYEAVKDEVNARAERMACKDFGIPEGGYEFGMCHTIWKYKKEILKTEYGINWHSPAELNPQTCFD